MMSSPAGEGPGTANDHTSGGGGGGGGNSGVVANGGDGMAAPGVFAAAPVALAGAANPNPATPLMGAVVNNISSSINNNTIAAQQQLLQLQTLILLQQQQQPQQYGGNMNVGNANPAAFANMMPYLTMAAPQMAQVAAPMASRVPMVAAGSAVRAVGHAASATGAAPSPTSETENEHGNDDAGGETTSALAATAPTSNAVAATATDSTMAAPFMPPEALMALQQQQYQQQQMMIEAMFAPQMLAMGNGALAGAAHPFFMPGAATGTGASQSVAVPMMATIGVQPAVTTCPPIALYLDHDENCLTPYQCYLRKHIELFEAGPDELQGTAQGRNTPLHPGQVGIRCRHCAHMPKAARARGGVYYSKTIDGVYQVAQNMSKLHLTKACNQIPENVKSQLKNLQSVSNRASGGKEYWAEGLRVLGVVEDPRGFLRFKQPSRVAAQPTHATAARQEEVEAAIDNNR